MGEILSDYGLFDEQASVGGYDIIFVDDAGNPVSGVMAQICDDATCNVLPSDENGKVHFEGKPYAYEVHVLVTPVGYNADSETHVLPAEGGELTITLTRVAP